MLGWDNILGKLQENSLSSFSIEQLNFHSTFYLSQAQAKGVSRQSIGSTFALSFALKFNILGFVP